MPRQNDIFARHYRLFLALLLVLATAPARAATFPSTLPPPPAPRYSGIRLFYQDDRGGALFLRAGQLRLEGSYRWGQSGPAADLHWQYLSGFTPAVMDGRVVSHPGLATHDLNLSLGWRFGDERFGITPQLHLRDLIASGAPGDQMFALGPGATFEFFLFPETTTIQLRYAHQVPFSHSSTAGPDLVSRAIPLLHLDLRIAYRIARPVEVSVGFQLRQLPSDLGRGRLFTSDTVWLRGFYIGTGVLF